MKNYRYITVMLVSVLLLLAAACSREGQPPAAGGTPAPAASGAPAATQLNACALVAKADIEQLVGTPVTEVKEGMKSAMTSQCTFVTEKAEMVDIIIKRSPVNYDVAAEMEAMKKAMPGVPLSEVPGIGDRAFAMGGQLNIYRGNLYVLVSMMGFSAGPKTTATAKEIAGKVLSRL